MINLGSLLANSFWIFGTGFLFAILGYLIYLKREFNQRLRASWSVRLPGIRHLTTLCALLTCTGIALVQTDWFSRLPWIFGGGFLVFDWVNWWTFAGRNGTLNTITPTGIEPGFNYPSNSVSEIRRRFLSARFVQIIGHLLERSRLLWIILLIPLFTLAHGAYILLGLTGLSILWLLTGIFSGQWGRKTPVDFSLLVWIVLIPVSLWVTSDLPVTITFLGYFLVQLVVFSGVITWSSTLRRLQIVALVIITGGAALALAAPLIIDQGQNQNRFYRIPLLSSLIKSVSISGELKVNPNVIAGTLVVLFPFSLAMSLGYLNKANRVWPPGIFALLMSLLMALAIFFVQSRGAYLAAGLSVLILFTINFRVGRYFLVVATIIVVVGLTLLVSLVGFSFPRGDSLSGLSERIEIWSRAIYLISNFPFTGVGFGTFSSVTSLLYPFFLINTSSGVPPHAHNLFLQVGVDLGLLGLISYIGLLSSVVFLTFRGWREANQTNDQFRKWFLSGGLAGLTAYFSYGLTDAVTWGTRPAFLDWAFMGLLLADSLQHRSKMAQENHINKVLINH